MLQSAIEVLVKLEDLAIIGNCQYSALVDRTGSVVWACMPRFDSEPLFASLLDERDGGCFQIAPADGSEGVQRYVQNTNVLETQFTTAEGSFRVIDVAPRFWQYERMYRPTKIVRIVEPLQGAPRIRVRCSPILGWSKQTPAREYGSNHINFQGYDAELRLTTDVPLSYVDGIPFVLTEKKHFVLSWGSPVQESLPPLCDRFYRGTVRHWVDWVKNCSIPSMYQAEVIRSALALKLHVYEDTGAIVAAMTTSIPESPASGRTWDYRYCWLRDAYYVLDAFRLLGRFEEIERFSYYLLNIAASTPDLNLAPLYRVDGTTNLEETLLESWSGYRGDGPVRVGNAAAQHTQNDIFGEMVLALLPLFSDERFRSEQSEASLELMRRLTRKAIAVAGQPDAGIWEYRQDWHPQTFSSLMSWAAADRVANVLQRYGRAGYDEMRASADRMRDDILTHAWHAEQQTLVARYGGTEVDAALLQAVILRFLPPTDPRVQSTIDAVLRHLLRDGWLLRYNFDDGFGVPTVAFVMCSFWLVQALVTVGRVKEARAWMDRICQSMTPLGLLSEDVDPRSGQMWGNFPQAYSHVGLIHAAFSVSPPWHEVL
jgi:GH15 family glucan-1,4-alpha-glucosidase